MPGNQRWQWVHPEPWHHGLRVLASEGGAQDLSLGLVMRDGNLSPATSKLLSGASCDLGMM